MRKIFHVASAEDVLSGRVTDVYFTNVEKTLKLLGVNPWVSAEVRASSLPDDWPWAVFAGLEEALRLLEGREVDVYALPEGTLFKSEETVFIIEGRYLDFAVLETALLGFICQATGVATKAARCRVAAGDRLLLSFGARRIHPFIAPMVERNAFIGGCDGVSVVLSAELIGERPTGTMSHSLMLCVGDERTAFQAFDRAVDPQVRRVALIDTFQDEKFGAITAAEALGERLFAVRLDTPGSRRGDFPKILREVRWELDIRGYRHVKILVSGGIDEQKILQLNPYADGYGVGTSISNAPVVDFSFDIVEVEGKLRSKRGKMSGKKRLYRCSSCGERVLVPWEGEAPRCECGKVMEPLLVKAMEKGKILLELPRPQDIRARTLEEISGMEL
ncbi:MAG: nicotinate phosphoribosyltransferase [Candidatus Geothermincolales bacterium]